MAAGFVYVLVNAAFPKWVKIGRTSRSPEERANELSGTSTPHSFIVTYSEFVTECELVESIIHEKLDKFRVTANREFFDLSSTAAIHIVQQLARPYAVKSGEIASSRETPASFAYCAVAWKSGSGQVPPCRLATTGYEEKKLLAELTEVFVTPDNKYIDKIILSYYTPCPDTEIFRELVERKFKGSEFVADFGYWVSVDAAQRVFLDLVNRTRMIFFEKEAADERNRKLKAL